MARFSFLSNAARALGTLSQDCALCGERSHEAVCTACSTDLPRLDRNVCSQCAASVVGIAPGARCGHCVSAPPRFDQTIAVFSYAFPLDRLLQSYKFNAALSLVSFFGDALTDALPVKGTIDLIIPLPLGPQRLASRGFNQSALVAEHVARRIDVAIARDSMLKVRETPPQSGLGRDERYKNVRGAFATTDASAAVAGKRIALVDDVMTTGATLSEAAKVLKLAGATEVHAWVLARAALGGA